MFDINTIINNAIAEAVNARITELLQQHANIVGALEQRIVALEEKVSYLDNRLTASAIAMGSRLEALENNPAIGVDTTLAARVTKLENEPYDKEALVAYLSQQEWFWEKLQNFVDTGIEKSMDNHLECYNHDEYDDAVSTINDYDFDDFLTKDDLNSELRDQINDTLNNATVSISV